MSNGFKKTIATLAVLVFTAYGFTLAFVGFVGTWGMGFDSTTGAMFFGGIILAISSMVLYIRYMKR